MGEIDFDDLCWGCHFYGRKDEACYRYPPTPIAAFDEDGHWYWTSVNPEALKDGWCGEHKRRVPGVEYHQ